MKKLQQRHQIYLQSEIVMSVLQRTIKRDLKHFDVFYQSKSKNKKNLIFNTLEASIDETDLNDNVALFQVTYLTIVE